MDFEDKRAYFLSRLILSLILFFWVNTPFAYAKQPIAGSCDQFLNQAFSYFPERRSGRTKFNPKRNLLSYLLWENRKLENVMKSIRGPYRSLNLDAIQALQLATETGSQELSTIRINLPNSAPLTIVQDYDRVLTEIKTLKLVIIIPKTIFFRDSEADIRKMISPENQSRVLILKADRFQNMWAQDGSKPLAFGESTLMQPYGTVYYRPEYNRVTKFLENFDFEIIEGQLPFEGGNVIVGDYHVFMGSDQIEFLMDEFDSNRSEIYKAYEKQFGKPVIEIGVNQSTKIAIQPAFHIDLIMTVVRDWTQPGVVNVVVIQYDAYGTSAYKRRLDLISENVLRHGYQVIRIPGNGRYDNLVSYNNVILSGRTALVPKYNLPTDETAYDVYRLLGYNVIPMSSSEETIKYDGAIRCISETYRVGCISIE